MNSVLAACVGFAVAGLAGAAQAGADNNPGHLKMALVNMRATYSDGPDAAANKKSIQSNIERMLYFIDKLAPDGVEFVGFPELSLNGYHFSQTMTWLSLTGPEVQVLQKKAAEKKIYLSAGMAEQDAAGKKFNTQFLIDPTGKLLGWHHKIWLTKEVGFTEGGKEHNVFEVKGTKLGICVCADGTDFNNLKALADKGAKIIYAPHANTTGGTVAGWYKFRARWGGPCDGTEAPCKTSNDGAPVPMPANGWIAKLKVYAALHNTPGIYNSEYNPPGNDTSNQGWASGAWFIGPDGKTLAQMPASAQKTDSKEFVLVFNVPLDAK